MQEEKVNIAQGYPKTRERLRAFQGDSNLKHPLKKLKTLADAIDFAIQEAEKVPLMEKDIARLEDGIIEMSTELGDLKNENEELKKKIAELETENMKLKTRVAELEDVN